MGPPTLQQRAEACYLAAYELLPGFVFSNPATLHDQLLRDPNLEARMMVARVCIRMGTRLCEEDRLATAGTNGTLNDSFHYHIISFPHFPPHDISGLTDDQIMERMGSIVLAPYFAAILYNDRGISHYLVLGQSLDAGTTLREVNLEANMNLASGCEPKIEAFLGLLRERFPHSDASPPLLAAFSLPGPNNPKRWWQFWRRA